MNREDIEQQILSLVEQYRALQYAARPFQAGTSVVPPSGKVLGVAELKNMVEASLDGWLTTGRFNEAFENSSADLLAFTALVGFSTTVNPMLQNGMVPVFVAHE